MGQLCCKRELEYDSGDVTVPTVPTWKAVASLILIFAVYVGVQVLGQAYPVLNPVGMRCYQNHTYECQADGKNKSTFIAATSKPGNDCYASAGCVEFSDAQQGALTGLALTAAYLVAGIPLAKATTAGTRVVVLAVSQVFLVSMAVLTAVSERYYVLWLARLGVGFGEAACNTAAYSLISDYFLAMNRAKALSFFYFATNFGIASAYFLGVVNAILCWRWVFYCLAITGGVMFLLILVFLREPPYESSDSLMNSRDVYTIKDTAYRLKSNKAYLALCSASSARYLSTYALWAWLPTFYARAHQVPSEEYGLKIALVVLFGGALGCLAGAILADRISKRRRQYKVYMIAVSQLVAAPFVVATLLVSSTACSFSLLFLACIAAEISPGPAASVVQDLFSVNLSSKASSVYVAVSNIIGGTGPIMIAGIMSFSQTWSRCDQGVGAALAILLPVFHLSASALFALTGCLMSSDPIPSEETIYLKYETSEVDPDSDTERETIFYGSQLL